VSALLEALRAPVALLAALASGLQAGLYYAFSIAVLPGLLRGDPRTYVATMQQVNVAIVNPWFLLTFLGAPLLGVLAVVAGLPRGGGPLALAALGAAAAVATFVITVRFNIPLNDALAAAGDPASLADPAAVRDAFHPAWASWNAARAVTSTVALAALAGALVAAR
jgi:uncharacterized membrane protein